MSRQGGINFTSKRPGGYRPKAKTLVTLDAQQMKRAIESGLTFFHNEFSGLVFGVGKKKENGTWVLKLQPNFLPFHLCRPTVVPTKIERPNFLLFFPISFWRP